MVVKPAWDYVKAEEIEKCTTSLTAAILAIYGEIGRTPLDI